MKNTCNRKFWLLYTEDFESEAELVVWIMFVRRGVFRNSSSTIQLELLLLLSYPDEVNEEHVQPQIWILYKADFEQEAELVVWIMFVRRGIFWNITSTIQLEVLQLCSFADKVNENHVEPQILTP